MANANESRHIIVENQVSQYAKFAERQKQL